MVQARHSRWVSNAERKKSEMEAKLDGKKSSPRDSIFIKRLELVWASNWFFVKPMMIAMVPTIMSVAMKWYQIHNADKIPEGVFPDESLAYSSLSWVLGFVLTFRTGQAYNRYWDGARSLHRMTVELQDACAQMIAFAESSKAKPKKIEAFRLAMIRLFSLFHGVALQQITDVEDEDIKIIDPSGLDMKQLKFMRSYERHSRPDIVMQWIIRTMTEAVKSGVVDTPAPIVSRAYQECNSGLVALFEMRTIAELPFPIPYAKMVFVLLCVHMFITPFYVVSFTNARFWAGIYSFTSVFSLWCIQYIALELEQPFGDGVNNLDLAESQTEMNDSLMMLLNPKTQWTPDLEAMAEIGTGTLQLSARRISHAYASSGPESRPENMTRTSMAAAMSASNLGASTDSEYGVEVVDCETLVLPSSRNSERSQGTSGIPILASSITLSDERIDELAKKQEAGLPPQTLRSSLKKDKPVNTPSSVQVRTDETNRVSFSEGHESIGGSTNSTEPLKEQKIEGIGGGGEREGIGGAGEREHGEGSKGEKPQEVTADEGQGTGLKSESRPQYVHSLNSPKNQRYPSL